MTKTELTFKCVACNGVFIKGLTDEQAEEQFKKEFPNHKRQEDDGVVCEDCFKKVGGSL